MTSEASWAAWSSKETWPPSPPCCAPPRSSTSARGRRSGWKDGGGSLEAARGPYERVSAAQSYTG